MLFRRKAETIDSVRINNLCHDVGQYIEQTIAAQKSGIKFSIDVPENSDYKHSLRDNYNESAIDDTMNTFSKNDSVMSALYSLKKNRDMTFAEKLLEYVEKKNLKDVEVYKAAGVDRRLYSKIISGSYQASKDTCVALCMGLRLTVEEANDLLKRTGYTLSHSSRRDIIIEYFLRKNNYKVLELNEVLVRMNEKPLGR